MLAATFTTAIVFFPVVFLYGVSKYLFTALALGVVLALAASYLVAMTVVPLFCAKFIKMAHGHGGHLETKSAFGRFVAGFNHRYNRMLGQYDAAVAKALERPVATVVLIMGSFVVSLALVPLLGVAFFPAHRSRPVCDQRQGAQRLSPGGDEPVHRPGGGRHPRGHSARMTCR